MKVMPMVYVNQKTREYHDGDVAVVVNEKKSSFIDTKEYHPTKVMGVCNECKMVGHLDFPNGFSYKIGDKIMDRNKTVKCWCIGCEKETEFIPYVDGKITEKGREFLNTMQANLMAELEDGKAKFKE